jgi:hypothetical protein
VTDQGTGDVVREGVAPSRRIPDGAILHGRERWSQRVWASLDERVKLPLELVLVGGEDSGIDELTFFCE